MIDTKSLFRFFFLCGFIVIAVGSIGMAYAYQSTSAEKSGEHNVHLPLILKNYANTGPSIFGVQMYGDTRVSSQYHFALMGSQADWVRAQLNWSAAEPANVSPENYNFGSADNVVAASKADSGDVHFIATIHGAPAWAAPGPRAPIYASALPDFAEFVGTMVERYDGDGFADAPGSPIVTHWEFYNEPDANSDYFEPGWGSYGEEYAQMLSVAYPAVKSANPQAQVLFGGIAYDWFEEQNGPFVQDFLDDVLAAGGGAYFDVMNFHSYPSFAFNWTTMGPGLFEKTMAVRAKLTQYGVGDKPIMITEAGWHSNNPPGNPSNQELQARYVPELFVQSMAADVEVMIWWMLHDPGGFYSHNGLVTAGDEPTPKLAYWAYQTAVSQLSTTRFDYRLTVAQTGAEDMEAYKFFDFVYNRQVYVAWLNPVDSTAVKPLSLPGSQAVIRDSIYGNAQTIVDDDGNGFVTIQISAQPIYIEINQ